MQQVLSDTTHGPAQMGLFDYAQLEYESSAIVQQRTAEIKSLIQLTAQDLLDIGPNVESFRSEFASLGKVIGGAA